MAVAGTEKLISVPFDKLFDTITAYEKYAEFVDSVKDVKVTREVGRLEVQYSLSVMGKDFTYTLKHSEDRSQGRISWELLSSDFFKKNTGHWELKKEGEGATFARYQLDVEFKVPIPGFILNKLVKGSLPSLMKNFEDRAKQR